MARFFILTLDLIIHKKNSDQKVSVFGIVKFFPGILLLSNIEKPLFKIKQTFWNSILRLYMNRFLTGGRFPLTSAPS